MAEKKPSEMRQQLRAIAEEWMSFWQGKGMERFEAVHAEDFVDCAPSGRGSDRAAFRQSIVDLYAAFPDFYGVAEDLVIDETASSVAIRWTATGTHATEFMGYRPTNSKITFAGIEIIRIADGQVTERWGEWDGLSLLAQLSSG